MDEETEGIIVRTRPFRDTSLIVLWLTRDHGRISTIARGALRPKSPFRGKLDLYYSASLSFLPSRRSALHTLREVVLRQTHPALRTRFSRLEAAAYANSLIERFTETDTPIPGFHTLFSEFLDALQSECPQPLLLARFETLFLAEAGSLALSPRSTQDPASLPALLHQLLLTPWARLDTLSIPTDTLRDLNLLLLRQLGDTLDRLPPHRTAAWSP